MVGNGRREAKKREKENQKKKVVSKNRELAHRTITYNNAAYCGNNQYQNVQPGEHWEIREA